MKPAIIITGATGYFGRHIIAALEKDFKIIALGRSHKKLTDTFPGDNIFKYCCDLNNTVETKSILKNILSEHDVSSLINNAYPLEKAAGFNTPEGNLDKHSPEMFEYALRCGLISPFVLIQAFGDHLIKNNKSGSIINISSMYSSVAPDPQLYKGKTFFNPVSYGATKAALEYITKYVASFWGAYGIKCNAIAPGPFTNTESESENSTTDEAFIQRLKEKTCNNNIGRPSDLIGTIRLLLGPESDFINGQTIKIDGGWTVR